MSNSSHRRHKHSQPDIDISTRSSGPKLGWRGNLILWGISLFLILGAYYSDDFFWWLPALIPAALIAFIAWILWQFFLKRGVWTWMRLAQRPAKLRDAGDVEGAEEACAKALARARQFADDDPRRAMMMCELGLYIRLQGRYAEAIAVHKESAEIFEQHQARQPFDYFVALNNYGICFIHLRDYATAQAILEKAIDLTLAARKREANSFTTMPLAQVQALQFVLYLNLAFLFIEMHELGEAELQLREADALAPLLAKRFLKAWRDHYVAMCALWEFESGNFAEAQSEIDGADKPNYPACLRIRAKLCLIKCEFAMAEELLRQHQAEELKRGVLHRPDFIKPLLELADALHGQNKSSEALALVLEAQKLVAEFQVPFDKDWRRDLATWLARAKQIGNAEAVTILQEELAKAPAPADQRIAILDTLRVKRPEAPG